MMLVVSNGPVSLVVDHFYSFEIRIVASLSPKNYTHFGCKDLDYLVFRSKFWGQFKGHNRSF